MTTRTTCAAALLLAVESVLCAPALAQATEEIATGLVLPIGLEADGHGQLWVSEMGANPMDPTAPGVGRVSMLARNLDGGYTSVPLVENLQVAFNAMQEPSGSHHISFAPDGSLLLATGGPQVPKAFPYLGSVLRFDPTYEVLAAGPHAVDGDALIEAIPVFPFVRQDAGYNDSNVYSVATVGEDLWIVDAGANAVIKYSATDGYSVLAEFPNKTNPKGTVPPTSQAVPTRIVPDGDGGAFVVQLTGYPFVASNAEIYRLSSDGSYTTVASGLSSLVDIEVAADGSLLVCSAGDFDLATGMPASGTGQVLRVLPDGSSSTFIGGLWLPTAVEIVGDDVFVSQFFTGTVTRFIGLAPQACPGDLNGDGNVDGGDLGILVGFWGACP